MYSPMMSDLNEAPLAHKGRTKVFLFYAGMVGMATASQFAKTPLKSSVISTR